jgi:hypothetical protein
MRGRVVLVSHPRERNAVSPRPWGLGEERGHGDEDMTGWIVGIALGLLVVVIVVVLVATLITTASQIRNEAREARDSLERIRQSTAPLHGVDGVNASATGVLEGARAARSVLGG